MNVIESDDQRYRENWVEKSYSESFSIFVSLVFSVCLIITVGGNVRNMLQKSQHQFLTDQLVDRMVL